MDQYINEQCLILKNDCDDYDDALHYVDEVVNDTMQKYRLEANEIRERVIKSLKLVFNEK